ncbi:MAG: UDP-N-acetylmuramoyl-L-alanine--D-glutamate ligase [Actinomycetota bacterium]
MIDVDGARVLVLGLGVTGRAVATELATQGADVVVSDSGRPSDADVVALRGDGVEVEVGGHEQAAATLGSIDFVVPSPGISPHRGFLSNVRSRGTRVVAELDIAAGLTGKPIIAVTGTNGKTTVCMLAERIGRAAGLRTIACGNTETPFITAASAQSDADLFVVEASSFGLYFCETFHPRVAVVTNLVPDHLDWHDSFDDYRSAKARIAQCLRAGDLYLYPGDQPELADLPARPEGDRVAFEPPTGDELVVRVAGQRVRARGVGRLAERGRHFGADAAAAATALVFCGAGADAVEEALGDFELARHRLEPIGELAGVRVVDDSVSTNPHATIAALRSLGNGAGHGRIVLIAGGRNKGLDLSPLAGALSVLKGVVAMGEAAADIARLVAAAGGTAKTVGSMTEAVSMALDWADAGDIVLLSPACASHDMFSGYADRGRAFREACRALGVKR